ncbi:MAG: hypothetical protein JNJ70_22435 [Verrucomicrobiales bacterium]|nr:hypothetical protein [Verrucomicrobiales bacterium]
MKLADNPPKVIDEVMAEVRAIKRAISERHGNNIDHLLDSLIAQELSRGSGEMDSSSMKPMSSSTEGTQLDTKKP